MRTADFEYSLPPELIAQEPVEPRDSSRLLVVDRLSGEITHHVFHDLPDYLESGDCLVVNETRVMPARLLGHRAVSGGAVEILLIAPLPDGTWEAMVKPGRRLQPGARVEFDPPVLTAVIEGVLPEGRRSVRLEFTGDALDVIKQVGMVPLPPYIHQPLSDSERYQTVYSARETSVAAPTAGLHFTPQLLERIRQAGVELAAVDLTVGPGTFQPVRMNKVEDHIMHSEAFELPAAAAGVINRCRCAGGRVFAVGTTSARVLESMAKADGTVRAGAGATDLFIYPGYKFRAVDSLVTNFHLPRSTLLMLVCAFAGRELIMKAYKEAVAERYRFYSFGDTMVIL
ncbi:MAG: tRNA preQ1(34) S-adenosylmethionine ribosyltransferase-isomerase QueA [Actinomycetota bacterium]